MENVLLLGMGPTALSALDSLSARFRVAGVVCDAGGATEGGDDVVARARALGARVFPDLGIEGVEHAIAESRPDCVVVSSYDRILPGRVLAQCPFVNVHYAPLPEYRGRANVNWAIINGERETAVTIHVMAPGLDAGNVLYQQRVPIGPDDTIGELYTKLNELQGQALGDTVARHLAGYDGEPQLERAATYGCTRVPGDGEIDWAASTEQVYALVRALGPPYPGAYTFLDSRRLTILCAAPATGAARYVGRIPGRVVARSRRDGHVDVLTGDGVLRVHEVAIADSAVLPAAAVVGSTKQTLGLRTADLLAKIELLQAQLDGLTRAPDSVSESVT
jgi:methionyl-tRNA formyltransferase